MEWIAFFIIISFTLRHLDAFVTESTGCHHNGTLYADKSLVPTMEKCLSCLCNKKTLICRLKVCPEMPMPPPRGCVVVQKKNTCCPYLSCARLDSFYRGPTTRRIIAYLDHYERESIDRVVNENVLQRRSDDSDVDLYVCVKNGTVYKSGSAMSSSSLCSYCYCIGGSEKCVKPKCMLPVEGCKPIFVDSTCCPVRYDCSVKTSGKSSHESRYRKTSNKHFLRSSQRLQRNRGCTSNNQFYAEGQKMPSDDDRPCDICFCIRGSRKCAPKKCSPSLKNCTPVVPKGQCCPSSYDCGSQRDYSRAKNSRQFNLFSLIFGPENADANVTESPLDLPANRHPGLYPGLGESQEISPTTEKSFFDTIREGLEFIDRNDHVLADDDLAGSATTEISVDENNTTGMSFLDLLLAPSSDIPAVQDSDDDDDGAELKTTSSNYSGMSSWVDLLLGDDDDHNESSTELVASNKMDNIDTTISLDNDHTDSSTTLHDFDDFSGNGAILDDNDKNTAYPMTSMEDDEYIDDTTTLDSVFSTDGLTEQYNDVDEEMTTTFDSIWSTTTENVIDGNEEAINMVEEQMPMNDVEKIAIELKETSHPATKEVQTNMTNKFPQLVNTISEEHVMPSNTHNDFFSALFDGLSTIFDDENATNLTITSDIHNVSSSVLLNTTVGNKITTESPNFVPAATTSALVTTVPTLPHFKRISTLQTTTTTTSTSKPSTTPSKKLYTVTSTPTTKPTLLPFKKLPPLQTAAAKPTTIPFKKLPPIQSSTVKSTTKEPSTTATVPLKSVFVKTNPTILDADMQFDYNAEPTLPPSLPNLKIIPFLPADAVKADRKQVHYEYYHNSNPKQTNIKTNNNNNVLPTNSPAIIVDGHWEMPPPHNRNSKIDYDLYDDASMYPAITELYPTYPDIEDSNKAEYIYKFNVEGPSSSVSSSSSSMSASGGSIGDRSTAAFANFDFSQNQQQKTNGFSPPTKTEGGFIPKEPSAIDEETADRRQFIIDITTAASVANNESTTKVIEITTADPFKDVIKTEPPPDLNSLMEDKEKRLIANQNIQLTTQHSPVEMLPHDKDIIHITTDLPSNYSEYVEYQQPANGSLTYFDTGLKSIRDSSDFHGNFTNSSPQNTSLVKDSDMPDDNDDVESLLEMLLGEEDDKTAKLHPHIPPFRTIPHGDSKMTTPPPQKQSVPSVRKNTTIPTRPLMIMTTKEPTTKLTTIVAPSTSFSSTTTTNPFLVAPFNKLPFMDASIEVKPNSNLYPQSKENSVVQSMPTKFEGLAPAFESFLPGFQTSTEIEEKSPPSPGALIPSSLLESRQHASSGNLIDPIGILKLAGCNIYGRMYRVGRIILELSNPCLECKCTEVGVKCTPLDC